MPLANTNPYRPVAPYPDVPRVIQALTEVVRELGEDYVYTKHPERGSFDCTYVWEGKPDCIAARVLVKLGAATMEQLIAHEGHGCNQLTFTGLSTAALTTLRDAQVIQDVGRFNPATDQLDRTYGFALAETIKYATDSGWLG